MIVQKVKGNNFWITNFTIYNIDMLSIKTNKNKFTLIELLIVIAILGILISLLQPSLNRVLTSSQRLSCAQNLKSAGVAIFLYADDNEQIIAATSWPGTLKQKPIYKPRNQGGYQGQFNGGKAGYVAPYLGEEVESHTCPGTTFEQGLKTFSTAPWIRGTSTYIGFSGFWGMLRRVDSYYIIGGSTDARNGWDKYSDKPLLMDPIFEMGAWKNGRGRWELSGSVTHENTGDIPVLMLSGGVNMFDRSGLGFLPGRAQFISELLEN